MKASMPKVAVVVLTWNGAKWLQACLDSLLNTAYENLLIYVVDNASTDATPALIKKKYPSLTLIENRRNLGFAGGCNAGIRRALDEGADYVILLNQDTRVDPAWVANLVKAAEADPRIGILSPMQFDYEGSDLDPIFYKYNLLVSKPLYESSPSHDGLAQLREADWVVGAAFMMRRVVCEQVGILDPLYFFYYEEMDLCRRARYHGFHVVIVSDSKIFHHDSQVHSNVRSYTPYNMVRGRALYFWKDPNTDLWAKIKNYRRWWKGKPTKWPDDWRHRLRAAHIQLWILAHLPRILLRVQKERRGRTFSNQPRQKTVHEEIN